MAGGTGARLPRVRRPGEQPTGSKSLTGGVSIRTGTEEDQRFYGSSFLANERGDVMAELGMDETGVIVHRFDLAQANANRAAFGFFRDRRPDLYGRLAEDR